MSVQEPLGPPVAHASALFELARMERPDLGSTLRAVTERDADVLAVDRVGIWLFDESRCALSCLDLFLRDRRQHQRGLRLTVDEAPSYFDAVRQSRTLDAHDARSDPRTADLREIYLVPHGITSMLDVPIWRRGQVVGVLCHEHVGPRRVWSAQEQQFASHVADLVSRALEAQDRRRAEIERAELMEQLSRERDLLGEVLQQMPAGVVLTDASGRLLLENAEAERLLQARLEPGTPLSEAYPTAIDAEGRRFPWLALPVARALERREVVVAEEMRLVRGDGSIIDVSVNAAPVFGRDGTLLAAVTAFVDTSEHKRIEAELAEEARFREHFVAILGHDLRTPLMAVQMGARLLERACGEGTREARILARIRSSTRRMSRMIDDLLDFTRIRQHGGIPLERKDVDLLAISRSVVGEVRAAWPDRELRLLAEPGSYEGCWDPDRIAQALTNLVGNAAEHGLSDEPVTVRVEDRGDRLAVGIHNLGRPIPDDVAASLFKPFRTGPDGARGLGLGLFISHSIVTSHGGTLSLARAPAGGTTFEIDLPRWEADPPRSPLGPR